MTLIGASIDEFTIPPFDELTILIFGIPGSGKTRFCGGGEGVLFAATEPGSGFVQSPWPPVAIRNWDTFQQLVSELAQRRQAGDNSVRVVVIDIIDNLHSLCLDYVCKAKGVSYPPANDFGKTWKEITKLWTDWLRALMDLVEVRFISHATPTAVEVTNASGIKEAKDRWQPTFAGNKAAQYLDGVVNAMGYMCKNSAGDHCITFKQDATVAAKDRTDILAKLGEIKLPPDPNQGWAYVGKCYAHVAGQLGYKIKSRRI